MAMMRDLLVVVIVVLSIASSSNAQSTENSWSAEGGYTVLAEQFTAAWCEVCADVDPWMPEFTESNGNRVARVALHDDFDDPLGTPITEHRTSRYSNGTPSAPSFWFDGDLLAGGAPDRSSMHRHLLSAEGARSGDTSIKINASFDSGMISIVVSIWEWKVIEGTQISIFVTEDSVTIDESMAINGITTHHDVVRAYREVPLGVEGEEWSFGDGLSWIGNNTISHTPNEVIFSSYISIPPGMDPNELSVVAIHETIGDSETHATLGALRLGIGDTPVGSQISIMAPMALVIILSTLSFKGRSRKSEP
ncbi:MAG: hypothetical protein QGI73_06415 [Candidatus Thalassarchaeaceae archaeon]|jgi:hypothetical protein|nr:hypothetical protein [Candidatus Thalassarchaeaceae archaeon]